MEIRNIYICFIIAFLCWSIPFVCGVLYINYQETENRNAIQFLTPKIESELERVVKAFSNNDSNTAFFLILKNNLKVCILNITGGVLLGMGTLLNLFYNGFLVAYFFVIRNYQGLGIDMILKATLPHSFELIGVWLSGALGFFIAWNIIQVMRGKGGFTLRFYKTVGFYFCIVFFIILLAAYVEAYITFKFIT